MAFVTGGAGGIGAEVVRQLHGQGARIATIDIAGAPAISDVWFRQSDVRDITALQQAIRQASEELGPIRVLVNNVARDDRFESLEMTETQWDEMQAVNLRHVFFATQAVAVGMRDAGGGSVINYTSPSVDHKAQNLVAYATAKAGIYGLTRTLAGELGPWNIRVNAVQPGWVFTARQREKWVTPDTAERVIAAQALKEPATEADVASLILFLASEDSRMITGHIHHVDGGWT